MSANSSTTTSTSTSTSTSTEASLQPFYKEIAALPARQRIDRLLSRKDTMRVVRQMPVPDVLTTINDVGAADALEVVELLSPAQVQGILDLDGWRKDRLDPTSIGKWLKVLLAANPDRAAAQLRGLDLELLTLLFKVNTRIYDIESGEEPEGEGRHSITPDNRYLIAYGGVGADDETQAALHLVVERLMARDLAFVLRMCEAVRWELASQLEEDAFRWRNARLADLGFLPQHEAVAIYAYVDPDQPLPETTEKAPQKAEEPSLTSTDLTASPLLPWTHLAGDAVFGKALAPLSDEARDRVAHELMLTANRVHAADGQDSGDTDALKETVRRAAQTVGVGLAYLARGNEARLAPLVATTPVMMLFRVGHSLSLKLQTELRTRVKTAGSGLDGRGLLRLDAPLREVVAGFLRPRPILFAGLLDPRRVDYRPVASLPELAATAAALSEAAFRAALLAKLGASDAVFANVADADLPSHAAVLVTYLATGALAPSASLPQPSSTPPETTLAALLAKAEASAPLPGAKLPAEARERTAAYARTAWAAFVAAPSTATAWIG